MSVESFIKNIKPKSAFEHSKQDANKTVFTLYRSFVIYQPNLLINCSENKELAIKLNEALLKKFILTHETHNGRFKKSFICYKKIQDDKYMLPKASIDKLVEYKILSDDIIMCGNNRLFSIAYISNGVLMSKFKKKDKLPIYKDVIIELTDNQRAIVNNVYKKYVNTKNYNTLNHIKNPGCIIVAETGVGKTRIGYGIIAKLKRKALVVVPNNKEVLVQWVEEAVKAFGDIIPKISLCADINIRELRNRLGNSDIELSLGLNGDIVIGIINSLIKINGQSFDDISITIFDECHSYCSQEFSKIFWSGQTLTSIGLTASPSDRTDKFDLSLPLFIGPYLYSHECDDYNKIEATNYDVRINVINYYAKNEYITYESNFKRYELLTKDVDRNLLITNLVADLLSAGRHIFVFCDRRMHCTHLAKKVKEITKLIDKVNEIGNNKNNSDDEDICDDDNDDDVDINSTVYIMMGNSSINDINNAKCSKYDKGSVIFTTYSFCRQSIDFPRMDTIILAAPRRSGSKQVIGRILRYGSNVNIIRFVYDIVDMCSPLKSQYNDRLKYYISKNYAVNELKTIDNLQSILPNNSTTVELTTDDITFIEELKNEI